MSQITVRSVVYQIDGQPYEGRLAFDAAHKAPPGLTDGAELMGVTAGAEKIAEAVAAKGYVVLVADLYGQALRPRDFNEAGAAMTPLKDDRVLLRKRMQASFAALQAQGRRRSTPRSWRPSVSASVAAVPWSWPVAARR